MVHGEHAQKVERGRRRACAQAEKRDYEHDDFKNAVYVCVQRGKRRLFFFRFYTEGVIFSSFIFFSPLLYAECLFLERKIFSANNSILLKKSHSA